MKKLLIYLPLMLISYLSMAQDTLMTITNETTQTERIIDKYSDKVFTTFESAITSATPMIKEGFGWVVRLQIAKGVAYLCIPILFLIVFRLFLKYYKIASDDSKDSRYTWVDCDNGITAVITLVISCALFVGSIPATYHGLIHIMAPEWCAIKEIIQTFN